MHSPAAVVFDNLSGFARECLGIADDACEKLAATNAKLEEALARHEDALVLTKIAAIEIPITRITETVDAMIGKDFIKRSNRNATIDGIRGASREELFAILEKLAAVAICPVNSLHQADDGEVVEKAGSDTGGDSEAEDNRTSRSESIWAQAWKETKREARR